MSGRRSRSREDVRPAAPARVTDTPVALPERGDLFALVTAALLTPGAFPAVLGDDYPAACAALDLPPTATGYGLLFGQDSIGARWTLPTRDVPRTSRAIATWARGASRPLSPRLDSIAAVLPGWPLPLTASAPGLPRPRDPGASRCTRPAVTPPDLERWGPPRRRMAADAVVRGWAHWRARAGREVDFPTARATVPGQDRTQLVLRQLRGYLDSPPPSGRVRSRSAPGSARLLRAEGPGWSLAARTDDLAFVLLDEEPGRLLPVGRGPQLPGLLSGLDALARRQAGPRPTGRGSVPVSGAPSGRPGEAAYAARSPA